MREPTDPKVLLGPIGDFALIELEKPYDWRQLATMLETRLDAALE